MGERTVKAALVAFGLQQVALAVWMAVSPHSFYVALGPFGGFNDHYIRDAAAFQFGLGASLLIAFWKPSWRVPALAFNAISFGAHALNHLWDIGDADPEFIGYLEFGLLAVAAILLGGLAVNAERKEPG